jgi:hypothetical protein
MLGLAWVFWRRTLALGGVLVALLTAEDLYANFTGPYPHTAGLAGYVLSKCLLAFAWSMPVSAFAGGLAAAPGLVVRPGPAGRAGAAIALVAVAAAVALLLSGWLGEWLKWVGIVYGLGDGAPHLPANTLSFMWRQLSLANQPSASSAATDGRAAFGWVVHWHYAGALLTGLMAGLGLLVGCWTTRCTGAIGTLQRWAVGVALVLAWYGYGYLRSAVFGGEWPPAAFAYGVLLVPGAVFLALAWAAWVAGARLPPDPGPIP